MNEKRREQNCYEITISIIIDIKNVQQVHSVSLTGAQSVTVNAEILDKLLGHPLTDWSINQFIKDWENVYGEGQLTFNVK